LDVRVVSFQATARELVQAIAASAASEMEVVVAAARELETA
jgi:hypothetical protein